MKKVAVITSYKIFPAETGGQKFITNFLNQLSKEAKVHAICTKNNKVEKDTSFELSNLLASNPFSYIDIVGFYNIYRFLKRDNIQTLIIEHPYIGWMGILLKWIFKIRLIIHTHNVEYLRFQTLHKWWWPLLKKYETWILRKADHVFAISEDDKQWMSQQMNVNKAQISILPYGIFNEKSPEDKKDSKKIVCKNHSLNEEMPLIFFNGALDYKPNEEAVEYIVSNILPKLTERCFQFNLMIAGKNLDKELQMKLSLYKNVQYLGFVDDIETYTKAADIFINPVVSGGGVKTKLIEALAMSCTCISTEAGAIGVHKSGCGNKLKIVSNKDWNNFVELIIESSLQKESIPEDFYKMYSWKNIIKQASRYL